MRDSALYEGWVRHRRHAPVEHAFRYQVFMAYLDLGELPEVLDGSPLLASARRPAALWFRRGDYLGDPARPLREEVLDAVEARGGGRPSGPVRLLTQLRTFGHSFNPVSFYFCFDAAGERVEAVLAEVTNTPWHERHAYLLERGDATGRVLRDRTAKVFHVSPFLPVEDSYDWRVTEPGDGLQVHIAHGSHFDATLSLERRELTPARLRRVLARYPLMSLQVVARIYLNALRLKLKGVHYHPHPTR